MNITIVLLYDVVNKIALRIETKHCSTIFIHSFETKAH